MKNQQQDISEVSNKKYFTIIPNIYDDSDLSVYEFRLLVHYVRVGGCHETIRTTAQKTNMSHPMVKKSRDLLEGKGYINAHQNDFGVIEISIIDKWKENIEKYSAGHTVSRVVTGFHDDGHTVSLKKEHVKEELINDDTGHTVSQLSAAFWSASGIPEPAFGGKGHTEWMEGLERLQKMNATAEEVRSAVKILIDGKYNISDPGSTIKTIANSRNYSRSKKPAQSLGGHFQE